MKKLCLFLCISIAVLSSCDRRKIIRMDTTTSGVAAIAVDESLAPIIQLQVNVFEALNPEATIIPIFTSEIEAFDQFVNDSVRLIIGARELTPNEIRKIEERKQRIRSQKLAVDGIAIISHKSNRDSLISVHDLRKIFLGEARSWNDIYSNSTLGEILISFDSPNSSMARYIQDSICGGKSFGSNVRAHSKDDQASIDIRTEKTANQKVIDYVSNTPNAIGVIGVNWITNPADTTNLSFTNSVRVMAVSREEKATRANSYQPYPYQLALKQYPLTRDIFIIITDVRGGLPAGFVNFAAGDQGQRIITKAGLLPATRIVRMVNIKTT